MNAEQWRYQFPQRGGDPVHSCTIALSCDTAAIAWVPNAQSTTLLSYYAREVTATVREGLYDAPSGTEIVLRSCDLCGPLLGPVETLAEALALCAPVNREKLAPDKPPHR